MLCVILLLVIAKPMQANTSVIKDTVEAASFFRDIRIKYASDKNFSTEDSLKLVKAFQLSAKSNYIQGKIQYFDILGVRERNQSNYAKALQYHKEALQLIGNGHFPKEKAIVLNNIGVVYRRLDDLIKAMQYHLMALEVAEDNNDQSSICVSLNSLGNIYLVKKEYDLALTKFNAALAKEIDAGNLLGEAINYNNIGSVYEAKGEFEKATTFYFKSLEVNMRFGSTKGIAICYLSLGDVFMRMYNIAEAEKYLKKGFEVQAMLGDPIYTASCLTKLGRLYALKQDFERAQAYYNQGLAIARYIGSLTYINKSYKGLSEVYEQWNKPDLSLKYFKLATSYQDSILDEEKAKDMNLKQVLYETGKKDKEIELLKYKEMVKDKKQKIIVGALILGCIILLVFLTLIYLTLRLKHKAHVNLIQYNRDIEEKNKLLIQQKEEIMAQRDQIEDKNQQLTVAYETIKIKNNNIIDNIHYAVQIQNSLLPDPSLVKSIFPQSFIYYEPKDLVSGDFYWVAEKDSKKIIVVADCTGHGVTGAFMSILGINALNTAVNENGITDANLILDSIRENIVRTLQQGESFTESKEGIHMAVCSFDADGKNMQFAGAINSIMLAREGEILQYKGDKMPISISPEMARFSTTNIPLRKDDLIYFYTDGYYGQFGGAHDRKFGTSQFKLLLQEISPMTIEKQLETVGDTMYSWMSGREQVDDMLVMGVRV
ncbi:MAG TPA: tetratricopeptide repeat protein [Bacteroidales bacterium]|nr:tetratricopeptide repeat protein [Bacteroidales bacterium]